MTHADSRIKGSVAFGDCELLPDGRLLTPTGDCQLTKRKASLLATMLRNSPIAVSSDSLLDQCWGVGAGTPQQLAKAVFGLRKALVGSACVTLESVYGYGYRIRIVTSPLHPEPHGVANAICVEAYHRLAKRRGIAIKVAQSMFEEAARVDPNHAPAKLGYAECRFQAILHGYEPGVQGWPAIASAARDALELEPASPAGRAYLVLAESVHDWNYTNSEVWIDEVRSENTHDPVMLVTAGRCKLIRGLYVEALAYFRHAMEMSPMNAAIRAHLIFALTAIGEVEAARAEVARLVELEPDAAPAHRIWFEAVYGDPAVGIAIAEDFSETVPLSSTIASTHALALANYGKASSARSLLESMQDAPRFPAPDCAPVAQAWCSLGDLDAATNALERAAAARDFWLGPFLWHPVLAPLHGRPAFESLRKAVSRGLVPRRSERQEA